MPFRRSPKLSYSPIANKKLSKTDSPGGVNRDWTTLAPRDCPWKSRGILDLQTQMRENAAELLRRPRRWRWTSLL